MSEQTKPIELPGVIAIRDLAEKIEASPIDIIKLLMANGVIANINQQIDFDTAAIVLGEMGFEAELEKIDQIDESENVEVALWRQLIEDEDPDKLVMRPPVITILGHVDHGKTTLLDAIRSANVVSTEAGGITQAISAYQIEHENKLITFLDTPGHAAFTAMRSRGAQGADIVILVVAADDGVMPQTKEAISHAKAANVPIIVALNKIDKDNANPENVKKQLADNGLIPDEWDGDTMVIPISALKKKGLEDLMEAILLVAENTEIKANPNGKLFGTVIESEKDKAKGVLATILVQNGTLKMGDIVAVGLTHGKIKAIFDYTGKRIQSATPSMPVSIMGLNEVPSAGDLFRKVNSEKEGRQLIESRKQKMNDDKNSLGEAVTLENIFARYQEGKGRELRLIIKADVQGTLEPLINSLEDLSATDEEGKIKVSVIHSGTGNIGQNDVSLAAASKGIIIGFNVQTDGAATKIAKRDLISIRNYDIIYRVIEDIESALKGMLAPEEKELSVGKAEVRAVFKIKKIGEIAGCKVTEGEIRRNGLVRVIRQGKTLHEGSISSLKNEKEDVRVMRNGFECGIGVKDFNKIKEGDILECFVIETVAIV
jgi:translation initiation factor IF-2